MTTTTDSGRGPSFVDPEVSFHAGGDACEGFIHP